MDASPHATSAATATTARVRIWDLPTRLFHWSLALLVTASIVAIKLDALDWHMRFGYAILSLLLFRLLWGFAGSRYALFSGFVRGPRAVLDYLRGRWQAAGGHNPLGALSVIALIALLTLQAAGGLFANDGSFTEGPLAKLVSGSTSEFISTWHRRAEYAIYALVGLHVAAVLYYTVFKSEPILGAMIHGDRTLPVPPAQDDPALRLRALLLLALCAALVGLLATL